MTMRIMLMTMMMQITSFRDLMMMVVDDGGDDNDDDDDDDDDGGDDGGDDDDDTIVGEGTTCSFLSIHGLVDCCEVKPLASSCRKRRIVLVVKIRIRILVRIRIPS